MATTLKKQKKNTKDEFEERAKAIIVEFAQQVRKLPTHYEGAASWGGVFFIAWSVTNTGSVPLFMAHGDWYSFSFSFVDKKLCISKIFGWL